MVEQNLQKLKDSLESWKESLMLRQATYLALKRRFKDGEKELAMIKKHRNRAQRDLKEAKEMVSRLSDSVRTFESRVRSWNKNNTGKVLNSVLFPKKD